MGSDVGELNARPDPDVCNIRLLVNSTYFDEC
jgi:hypothetical protein